MACSDQLVITLKNRGYNAVRTPKADIAPLQLFTGVGKILNRYGEFSSLFYTNPAHALPAITKDIPSLTFINTRYTGKQDAALTLSFLYSIFSAWGSKTPALTTQYEMASTMRLVFHDITEDKVEPARVDEYLSKARINPHTPTGLDNLYSDNIFVVISVIKSNKITIEAQKANGESLALQTPDIQGVQAGIKVHRASSNSSHFMYEGIEPLVFGFQAIQLFYDDRENEYRYRLYKNVPAGNKEIRKGPESPISDSNADPYVLFASDSTFTYIY